MNASLQQIVANVWRAIENVGTPITSRVVENGRRYTVTASAVRNCIVPRETSVKIEYKGLDGQSRSVEFVYNPERGDIGRYANAFHEETKVVTNYISDKFLAFSFKIADCTQPIRIENVGTRVREVQSVLRNIENFVRQNDLSRSEMLRLGEMVQRLHCLPHIMS
jgi:hypothetical protein